MKRVLLLATVSVFAISCQQTKVEKTAYVDTNKIFKEYSKVKEADDAIMAKSEKAGKTLDSLGIVFEQDVKYFEANARAKGQKWAQQQQQELMQRQQQLQAIQQSIGQGVQKERAKVMDSIFNGIKEEIAAYAKKNGYAYVLGTSDIPVVIYGKEEYDITEAILSELNGGDNSTENKEPAKEVKTDTITK